MEETTMNASFHQETRKEIHILIGLLVLMWIAGMCFTLLYRGDWVQAIVLTLTIILYYFLFVTNRYKKGLRIRDTKLIAFGFSVDIQSIQRIEQISEGILRVYYLFNGGERKLSIRIVPEEREEFISCLLTINPLISKGE